MRDHKSMIASHGVELARMHERHRLFILTSVLL
jgi:hypothetical protein